MRNQPNVQEREARGTAWDRTDPDRPFARRVLVAVGITAAVVLLLWLVGTAAYVFLVVFAGVLLAVFLRSLSDLLGRHTSLSPGWSLAAVLAGLAALTALVAWLLAPQVAAQIDQLLAELPDSFRAAQRYLERYQWTRSLAERMLPAGDLLGQQGHLLARVTGFFSSTLNALAACAVVLFIGLYVAADPGVYREGLVRLVPPARRRQARCLLDEIGHTLQWWLLGRSVAMLVIAVVTTVGLWLIGIPLALALGILAGILNFIPYLGPILSVVPAALITLTQGPTTLVYVLILYAVIQLFESYLLTPLIQQRAVSLPPALIISAQVLLGVLVGVLGVVLATPLTASLVILARQLYVEDVLENGGSGQDHGRAAAG